MIKLTDLNIEWISVPENLDWKERDKLFIPGTLVKFDSGFVYLIGDINSNFGWCDCCSESGKPTHYCQIIDTTDINDEMYPKINIIINGKPYLWRSLTIHYSQICDLIGFDWNYEKHPTMTYRKNDKSKNLHFNDRYIDVEDGMVFTVTYTGKT